MNTYLVPFDNNGEIDIFKVTASSWEECLQKIMDKYTNKFDDDTLASISDFDDFCDYLYKTYDVNIGYIHEIEDFE